MGFISNWRRKRYEAKEERLLKELCICEREFTRANKEFLQARYSFLNTHGDDAFRCIRRAVNENRPSKLVHTEEYIRFHRSTHSRRVLRARCRELKQALKRVA
jgi:hypothetical protein